MVHPPFVDPNYCGSEQPNAGAEASRDRLVRHQKHDPTHADDLHGLPPTHLSVGGLDLFREESMSFAARLSLHDVKAQP